MGLNRTWFRLLQEARGRWWCCPGADDLLEKDFLKQRMVVAGKESDLTVIHGPAAMIDAQGALIERELYVLQVDRLMREGRRVEASRMLQLLVEHNYIIQPTVLANMERSWEVLPRFNTRFRYAPDWYLWLLLARSGGWFYFDETPLLRYRIHEASLSKDKAHDSIRRIEIRLVPLKALMGGDEQGICGKARKRWQRALESLFMGRLMTTCGKGVKHLRAELESVWKEGSWLPSVGRVLRALAELPYWYFRQRLGQAGETFRVSGLSFVRRRS
jgi:hypothetical protein